MRPCDLLEEPEFSFDMRLSGKTLGWPCKNVFSCSTTSLCQREIFMETIQFSNEFVIFSSLHAGFDSKK